MRYLLICLLFMTGILTSRPPVPVAKDVSWVDFVYNSLSTDEQIAQLMMIEVRPTLGAAHLKQVESDIDRYKVGGLIFFKGDPLEQVQLTNAYQKRSQTPLMIAIDGEWGLAMRLSNTTTFPYQMGLGGIRDNTLIYDMGREIGRQCRRMGIHVNFAPVIDINNNPNNPVINYRSFGEDKFNVAQKGWAYAKGMQAENVIACAKHFPGHGDTDVDSHLGLPVINHSRARLDSVELYPFRVLIDSGVMSVMTAHLFIPAIDNRPNQAISVSDRGINGLLRTELGFKGLSFTDALNMQGVAKFHEAGELEKMAFVAGNDILLAPGNIPKAIELIKAGLKDGSIKPAYLEQKVKKVLRNKYWAGLAKRDTISTENLLEDLNSSYATFLLNKLIEKQLCVVQDKLSTLPVAINDQQKIATISIGGSANNAFQQMINRYHQADHFHLPSDISPESAKSMIKKLKPYDLVLISLHETSKYPKNNYRVSLRSARFIKELDNLQPCVFVDFGNPYNLKFFEGMKTVVMGYEDNVTNQRKAAQLIFGAIPADAFLPVTVSTEFKLHSNYIVPDRNILDYGEPEEVFMSPNGLTKVDSIIQDAIKAKATPGAQILVARHGKIVYEQAFGHHTYAVNSKAVSVDDLYDLASLTKIMATTLAVMKLTEDSILKLDDPISKYLKNLDTTNKADITLREILTHTAGLKDWIPFYEVTVSDQTAYDTTYHKTPDDRFCIKVDDNLYMCKDFQQVIIGEIESSEIKNQGDYRYSDLGMILMRYVIEKVTHTSFDRYVDSVFYQPMGLRTLTFNPLNKFSKDRIIPTEDNADFRRTLIHGYVHDPAAAMLGGVSGHAGLFSNAGDLAAVMQMLLNGGSYNGHTFLHENTIRTFTSYQSRDSRRGLGFDKPESRLNYISPCSRLASNQTFGHSGFTGTQMWADPQNDLIFIFLSNRVHPTASNKSLISMSVRTKIMDAIYQSIEPEQ